MWKHTAHTADHFCESTTFTMEINTSIQLQLTKMRYTFITFKTSDCTQEYTRNNGLAYFTLTIQHKGTHES